MASSDWGVAMPVSILTERGDGKECCEVRSLRARTYFEQTLELREIVRTLDDEHPEHYGHVWVDRGVL